MGRNMGGKTAHRTLDERDKIQVLGCPMPASLENSAVATGLEKVSFHSNPKEMQCLKMLKLLHNCTHLTC